MIVGTDDKYVNASSGDRRGVFPAHRNNTPLPTICSVLTHSNESLLILSLSRQGLRVGALISLTIKESTLMKSLINVIHARKPSAHALILQNIRKFTLGRNFTGVFSAAEILPSSLI